nr:hypothetical protein Iba_chr15dCG8110 [Ipomoea batatas]
MGGGCSGEWRRRLKMMATVRSPFVATRQRSFFFAKRDRYRYCCCPHRICCVAGDGGGRVLWRWANDGWVDQAHTIAGLRHGETPPLKTSTEENHRCCRRMDCCRLEWWSTVAVAVVWFDTVVAKVASVETGSRWWNAVRSDGGGELKFLVSRDGDRETGRRHSHRRCFFRSESMEVRWSFVRCRGPTPEDWKATYVAAAGCCALFCLTPSLLRWRWVLSTSPPFYSFTAVGNPSLPLTTRGGK